MNKLTCNNMEESQDYYGEWKKLETKTAYFMIPFM